MDFFRDNYKFFLFIFLFVVVIVFEVLIFNKDYHIESNIVNDDIKVQKNDNIEIFNDVYIDIKGAVKKPGVYKVNENSIINDVIKLAGGLNSNGTTKNINLSKKVSNEMVIYIFTKTELKKENDKINNDNNIVTSSKDLASKDIFIDNNNSSIEEYKSNDENITINNNKGDNNKLININNASKEELLTISGIGESKADAIIKYRNENKFNSIEDIKNVSGIGESLFAKIKDYITV